MPEVIDTTVAVNNNQPVIVPGSAMRRAGFKRGQELEAMALGGAIAIVCKLPDAAGEYTPEQRRVIDARLAEAGLPRRDPANRLPGECALSCPIVRLNACTPLLPRFGEPLRNEPGF